MDFGISTRCFGDTPLTTALLDRLRRAEFELIELHASLPGFDYGNRSSQRGIARWFADQQFSAPSLHLPYSHNLLSARPMERQRAFDDIKRCLELGDFVPLRYAVLHLGANGDVYHPVVLEHAYAAISMIQSFAGLRVLLETLPNEIATFDRISEFRTVAQTPDVGICYDTGHGDISGTPDAIHLDDNRGSEDEHLWPFDGTLNWPALVDRLVTGSFEGPLILEAGDDRLDKASSGRSRLRDLIHEATNSIEEFRLKHRLLIPQEERE